MKKSLLLIICFFITLGLAAQETQLSAEDKAALDSMFQNDEFIKMINQKSDTSYFEISAGVSNGVFSIKNNSLNASQATTSKLFYTPSLGYIHKSGFGISVTGFLAADQGALKFFQYAISPAYSYTNKKFAWGVSYTRNIKGASTSFDVNPYQNDLYGSFSYKKPWIKPSVGIGLSTGKLTEYFDSVITFVQVPRTVTIRDTITTRFQSFSLNLSVSHTWEFEHVLFKRDAINVQPSIAINGSNQRVTVEHSSSLDRRRPVVQKLLKNAYGDGVSKEKFSFQSVAGILSVSYGTGNFILQPQVYLDYYLRETSLDRFSAIYSFSISYAF